MIGSVSETSLTALSTFSGIGGLDLGLERAGFSILCCVEADETARRTLRANCGDWQIADQHSIEAFVDSVASRKPTTLRELDLLAGAPPCQPYSKAAMWSGTSWNGLKDPRASTIQPFLRLVDLLQPRAFLIENVQGFISGRTSALDFIAHELREINRKHGTSYSVQYRCIDAADVGVPQRRKRAIVAAFRDGQSMHWPVETHAERPIRAWDALHDVCTLEIPETRGRWKDLLPSIPEGSNYLFHTSGGAGEPLFGYRTRYWSFLLKLAKDRPSWTLPAQPGPSTGPFHWDNRPLAIEEMLRIQSFPLPWALEGSRREKVRQAGNATPPLLAELLGHGVRTTLDDRTPVSFSPSLRIERVDSVPPPRAPTPVPRNLLSAAATPVDHPGEGKGPRPRPA